MSTPTPPASAGDVLGAAGVPLRITYRGQSHPVHPATLRVVDRVEKLVAVRANAAAEEMTATLPPAAAKRHMDRLDAKLDARQHATGGSLWDGEMTADGGTRGLWLILFACLQEARERAADRATLPPPIAFEDLPAVLAESPDAGEVVALLMPDFFQAIGSRLRLPPATVATLIEEYRAALARQGEKAEPSAA